MAGPLAQNGHLRHVQGGAGAPNFGQGQEGVPVGGFDASQQMPYNMASGQCPGLHVSSRTKPAQHRPAQL